jgi:fructokinase
MFAMALLGAIEGGGTKFVLAVCDEDMKIVDRQSIPTEDGEKTLDAVIAYFDQFEDIKAVGIAMFGPIDINPESKTYGRVLDTPKRGWSGYDFMGRMKAWRDIPYYWTTDVNGAAWAEYKTGAVKENQSMVYLTIGTGVGAGIINRGHFLAGYGHPEAGHIMIQKHPKDDYQGHCPFHQDHCLEGLASGPAMAERWDMTAKELPDDHIAWEIEADYLAQAAVDFTVILRPDKIIFGGGVPHRENLLPMVRKAFADKFRNYLATPDFEDYIVPVSTGDNAGIIGCFYLAQAKLAEEE